jgi:hypothetical protein
MFDAMPEREFAFLDRVNIDALRALAEDRLDESPGLTASADVHDDSP